MTVTPDQPYALDPPPEIEALIAQLLALTVPIPAPAPYPHDEIDERGGQDDLDELLERPLAAGGPNTQRETVQLGWHWIRAAVFVGVGMCLKTIRSLFGVAARWPDAETGWEQTEHKHRTNNPEAIPWGVPVWWVNGRFGHIALSLGKGRCMSTDFRRTGFLGLAPIAALASWCGGRLVGWSEDLNGVLVVPPPKPALEPFDLDDRIKVVRAVLERAIAAEASERRVAGLRKWLKALQARRDKRGARK